MFSLSEQPGEAPMKLPEVKAGESSNAFSVVSRGDGLIGIYRLPVKHLNRSQALNLAAWLSVIADPDGREFQRLVKEIRK